MLKPVLPMRFLSLVLAISAAAGFGAIQPSLAGEPEVFSIPGAGFGPMRPVVAELDGDATNGKEVVITTSDGTVQALSSSGAVLWSARTPNVDCAATPTSDKMHSSAVVGDLYGTGEQYVVAGYGGFRGKPCDGGVIAYRGKTGEVAWVFSIRDFAKRERFFAFRHAVYGTPTLADVDRDGKLEVGFGSFDRNVYLLNANGSVRWYYNAADTVFTSPAFSNVAGGDDLEMIVATDISRNTRLRPPTPNGGYVYALRAAIDGKSGTKYGFRSSQLQQWRTQFNQVMQSSPVVADLLPANAGLEVVVGSGCFFPQGRGDRRGKWFKVLSATTGRVLKTLTVTSCNPTTAAVGDINSDGILEVVVPVSGLSVAGGDGTSRLIAWQPATDRVLWSVQPRLGTRTDSMAGFYNRTPVIADVNNDGAVEVLANYSTGVVILSGATGEHLTCDSSPCIKPLLRTDKVLQGSPVVDDTNADGTKEVLVAARVNGVNALVRWVNPLAPR
jgi:hypothetical protein